MYVQQFCQNSLTRSITNSNLCTEIVYGTTTKILVDSRPYMFHFWGCCCRAWPTWSIIISSRRSAILETSKPLKSSVTAHARITKSLFQHFKSFTSVLPNLTQNWCTPFVRQLPPYSRYQKIADGWCNTHIKIRATIKRFHIQPRHSAHSLTRNHHNTPSRETRELQMTCVLWALSWDFWIHLRMSLTFVILWHWHPNA